MYIIANVVILEPTLLTASITDSVDVSCNLGADGSATVTPVGGTEPYTYAWNGGVTPTDSTTTGLPTSRNEIS